MGENEYKGKQTDGYVNVHSNGSDLYNESGTYIASCSKSRIGFESNAALYAEAHNVANATGMWPQDLLDRIKDLENAPTVKEVWPYLQHKDGCRSKSFANSMISHAPISIRTCTCGLDELRNRLTKSKSTK